MQKNIKVQIPYRYDFVGSFLRPQNLKDAKEKFKKGNISKEEFDKIVNEEITKVAENKKNYDFILLQMENLEELIGIQILSEVLKELNMKTEEMTQILEMKLLILKIHI